MDARPASSTTPAPTIPVPRVPSPPVTAPGVARDARAFVPAPDQPRDSLLDAALDAAPRVLPPALQEGLWNVVKGANRVLFRSTPPGPPVPTTPGSWKFSVIGDYGGGQQPLKDVTANISRGRPDLIVTTGDNVYYNGTEQDYARKWDPPEMFGHLRRDFPVLPSLGNHDTRVSTEPYFRRFPELGGARFYSYDHKGVHFVALNTNESLAPGTPQHDWLDRDLAASAADWKVLYFHHPMNPGHPRLQPPKLQGHLAPLLAKHGVDLVLSGHLHNYQRTEPLNDGGTVEVVTGGGGHTLHPFIWKQPGSVDYRDVDFGHVEVEVTGDALVGRYVVRDGSVRDTFVVPNRTPGAAAAADARAGATLAGG